MINLLKGLLVVVHSHAPNYRQLQAGAQPRMIFSVYRLQDQSSFIGIHHTIIDLSMSQQKGAILDIEVDVAVVRIQRDV